ncbi:oligosaccharide flippase family protein [Rhodococcus sp. 14C212]|uniref:lipopolysaccharide biosynthesis protein n=1 Tax=Rhodococcus sp. 14C212 TaxID=2711209 RepID=UPI0013EB393A|nr:oligosaccharide flippase family protein [Rhodococcus sp. 14C212]NGP05306.1 oligosaccharide flippase family protein [Rhodococcus sp. 14C212]
MGVAHDQLTPEERRALFRGTLYRILGTPVVAVLGLANTAVIAHETGAAVFGLVSLIATITLLVPFVDFGIGATVLSASATLRQHEGDSSAADVIRRAYRVLFVVAAAVVSGALVVMAFDGWTVLVGMSSGPTDRWAITLAVCVFALTIPAGLGFRILIGIGRIPEATLVQMSCPAVALVITLVLYVTGVNEIWYAVSALGGLLGGQVLGTVFALRLSGLGWSAFARTSAPTTGTRLLAGSGWLFVVGVGLPIGLQSGRVLLAHLSTPTELSEYAVMAQIYGVVWSVLSTVGLAYWPVFVQRRSAPEETIRMWWRLTAVLVLCAAIGAIGIALLGPWAASVLSGGQIDVSALLALGFGVLMVAQTAHLPANVLLVGPGEARWQALWTVVMAALSLGLGFALAGPFGAVGVVCASVLGICLAQVLPDLLWVPSLVRRRSLAGP